MPESSLCPPTCVCKTLVVWASFNSIRGIREGGSWNALCMWLMLEKFQRLNLNSAPLRRPCISYCLYNFYLMFCRTWTNKTQPRFNLFLLTLLSPPSPPTSVFTHSLTHSNTCWWVGYSIANELFKRQPANSSN